MIKSDKKLGRKIRSANKMMELINNGAVVLYCPDMFGLNVVEFDVAEMGFAAVMDDIKKGRYFEEKKCQPK